MCVTLHALHNRDISLRFSETAVMTRAHMLPYVPLCAFCPQNECHSSHSWAESLFSRDDLQLISPSEHVEEGESSGDKRGGGISYTQTSLACRWAQETHRTGSVLFHWSVCVSVTAVLSVMCVCSCLSISLRASLSFSPVFLSWSFMKWSHFGRFPLPTFSYFRTNPLVQDFIYMQFYHRNGNELDKYCFQAYI